MNLEYNTLLSYIRENPCGRVRIPKFEKKPRERYIITPDDFHQILTRFPERSVFYLPLMIGYYTGLRISETFALTWDDIDLDSGTLTVNKSVLRRNCGVDVRKVLEQKGKKEEKASWYFGTTKALSSSRTIKMSGAPGTFRHQHHPADLYTCHRYNGKPQCRYL